MPFIQYDDAIQRKFSANYEGGLEQFAIDYETAYVELAYLGAEHDDFSKMQRILQNLYIDDETDMLCEYLENNCDTFAEVIAKLKKKAQKSEFFVQRNKYGRLEIAIPTTR